MGLVLTHNVGIFNVIFNYVVNCLQHKAQRQHMGLALTHNVGIFNEIFIPFTLFKLIGSDYLSSLHFTAVVLYNVRTPQNVTGDRQCDPPPHIFSP